MELKLTRNKAPKKERRLGVDNPIALLYSSSAFTLSGNIKNNSSERVAIKKRGKGKRSAYSLNFFNFLVIYTTKSENTRIIKKFHPPPTLRAK